MSWVKAEQKKRAALEAHETVSGIRKRGELKSDQDTDRVCVLWDKFEAANTALPAGLQLLHQLDKPNEVATDKPAFLRWLKAPNGAGLGFNGDAIRYYWPEQSQRKSNNFWICWEDDMGFVVSQRGGKFWSDSYAETRRFRESSVEHMIKCLVTGLRIKTRSIRTRRFWFF